VAGLPGLGPRLGSGLQGGHDLVGDPRVNAGFCGSILGNSPSPFAGV
jgi:hypothetical protein